MAKKQTPVLAAQLFTLREHLKTPAKIASTLKRVRKIGYRAVQVSGMGPIEPLKLKALLKKNGLKAIGYHANINMFLDDRDSLIDMLHTIGCSYVSIPYLPPEMRTNAASYRKTAKLFNKIGKEMLQEKIIVNYHNHCFEFESFGGKTGLQLIYENTDPKVFQAEIDTCWVARGGGDPALWCEMMKGRLDQVHFKDMTIINNEPVFAEIGSGNLNWPAILKACKKAGTIHYIVEQDACPVTKNPFKSLEISYKFLRKMGLK